MSLPSQVIESLAERVIGAQDGAHTIAKLTDDYPELSIPDAYRVQDALLRRWRARGHRHVGYKAGLTSKAKMRQMGVDVPSFGILTSAMSRPESGVIRIDELIHPRVEPEIAFVTKAPLRGAGRSVEEVLAATDFIIPAVEVIDSRYEKFKFDLTSVIADNGSSAKYVTGGRPRDPRDLDLTTLGVVIEKNGQIQAVGASAAVLGHPAEAIVMLLAHLAERDEALPEGSFVMTGGITEAIAVRAGDNINVRFQELGSVGFRFE